MQSWIGGRRRRVVLVTMVALAGIVVGSSACGGDDDVAETTGEQLHSGWVAAERLPIPRGSLASSGDRAVVVGRMFSDSGEPVGEVGAFYSDDGYEWEPAAGFEPVETDGNTIEWRWPSGVGLWGVRNADTYLAAGPRGFVAAFTGGAGFGAVAFSADGSSWDQIAPADLPATEGFVTNVVAGADGFVMVGAGQDLPAGFVWFSSDGRTWQVTDIPRHELTLDVAHNGSEWMAFVSLTGSAEDPAAAFMSADGLRWTEVASRNVPPDGAFWSYYEHVPTFSSPFAANGDTWVLIASTNMTPPMAWVSTDNGQSWEETEIATSPALPPTTYITDFAHTEYGFLAAGSQRNDPRGSVLLVSEDGITWEAVAAVSDDLILETLGDHVIATDGDGTVYVWSQ